MSETQLGDLGLQCLHQVCCFLSAKDLLQLSCAHSGFLHALREDEPLWGQLLAADYAQEGPPMGPDNQPTPSYRLAYAAWATSFRGDVAPYIRRAVVAWRKIEAFLTAHLPEVRASLRPGASEADIAALEERLDVHMAPALKAIYRLHDGQALAFDALLAQHVRIQAMPEPAVCSLVWGLFGGYEFYEHLTSVRLLPLAGVEWRTAALRRGGTRTAHAFGAHANTHLVFAANAFDSGNHFKFFACDAAGCIRVAGQSEPMLAAPEVPGQSDGVLRWFEQYAERLSCGCYAVEELAEDLPWSSSPCRGISLFPKQPPQMAVAVTRGVQVKASPLYIPEMSGPNMGHTFAYNIRMRLLPTEEQVACWPATAGPPRLIKSCQLLSRHWVILDGQGNKIPGPRGEIRGEAVIGKFPLLRAGEDEFSYASCTQQRETAGAMEGDFTFVEGSIRVNEGPEWEALCPRFHLVVPDYIY